MTGTANGDSPAGDPHSFTADKGYGQDTLLVHAGLPTHRCFACQPQATLHLITLSISIDIATTHSIQGQQLACLPGLQCGFLQHCSCMSHRVVFFPKEAGVAGLKYQPEAVCLYLAVCRSEGAAVLPIYQTATFGYHGILGGRPQGEYECWYTRPANNPNHMVNVLAHNTVLSGWPRLRHQH